VERGKETWDSSIWKKGGEEELSPCRMFRMVYRTLPNVEGGESINKTLPKKGRKRPTLHPYPAEKIQRNR